MGNLFPLREGHPCPQTAPEQELRPAQSSAHGFLANGNTATAPSKVGEAGGVGRFLVPRLDAGPPAAARLQTWGAPARLLPRVCSARGVLASAGMCLQAALSARDPLIKRVSRLLFFKLETVINNLISIFVRLWP